MGNAQPKWDIRKANSHFNPPQTGSGPHHHVEAAVDWRSKQDLRHETLWLQKITCIFDFNAKTLHAHRKLKIRIVIRADANAVTISQRAIISAGKTRFSKEEVFP